MIIGITQARRQVGQNPTKTKQITLPRIQTKQVLHRITKIKHVIVAARKDTSVLNAKRRIQERKKTGHFEKLSNIHRLRHSLQEATMNGLLITIAFRVIVHPESTGMDY